MAKNGDFVSAGDVRAARKVADLTQIEAANVVLKHSPITWAAWESGLRPMPRMLFEEFLQRTGLAPYRTQLAAMAMEQMAQEAGRRGTWKAASNDATYVADKVGIEGAQARGVFRRAFREAWMVAWDRSRHCDRQAAKAAGEKAGLVAVDRWAIEIGLFEKERASRAASIEAQHIASGVTTEAPEQMPRRSRLPPAEPVPDDSMPDEQRREMQRAAERAAIVARIQRDAARTDMDDKVPAPVLARLRAWKGKGGGDE